MNKTAILLLSGGLDSATILAMAAAEGIKPLTLSFSYGQKHSLELKRASQLAKKYECEHLCLKLDPQLFLNTALVDKKIAVPQSGKLSSSIPITYVPARNMLFLAHALALAESRKKDSIYLGVNAVDYSGYPDCRPEFIDSFNKTAALGTRSGTEGRPIQIYAPLLRFSKKEIIQKGTALGLDYRLTSSCYKPKRFIDCPWDRPWRRPLGRPCQKCDSCLLRMQGFSQAGLTDPLLD